MRRLRTLWIVLAGLLAVPAPAWALACSASATNLNFGQYRPFSALPNTSTATIQVTCNALVTLFLAFDVRLSPGASGTYTARSMTSGTNALGYNLFTSNAYSTVWGDGTGATAVRSFGALVTLFPFSIPYTIHGRIPALQPVRPGSYSDIVQVVITF
ncbi:Csu type fimbrial protein [Zavarzinia sp. CC-PAN008]|uniref:Csu type fimbrial protein n=1 Tax=Zavarzinia sp. CC-PAN008 TaxID=3243332 RepID=UPI003F7472EE